MLPDHYRQATVAAKWTIKLVGLASLACGWDRRCRCMPSRWSSRRGYLSRHPDSEYPAMRPIPAADRRTRVWPPWWLYAEIGQREYRRLRTMGDHDSQRCRADCTGHSACTNSAFISASGSAIGCSLRRMSYERQRRCAWSCSRRTWDYRPFKQVQRIGEQAEQHGLAGSW